MSVFGVIKSGSALEETAIAFLKDRLPEYLAEIERQTGRPQEQLPMIRSWTTRNEFVKWPEEQLPAMVVVSPGTNGVPKKAGDGKVRATYALGLAVVCSAKDGEATSKLARDYAAAIRACVEQHPDLGGVAEGSLWTGERFDDIPQEQDRNLSSGQVGFMVEVRDVVDASQGLTDKPEDPYNVPNAWPQVTDADTSTEVKE